MFIEGLGSITYVNGVLRVQCTYVNSEGKVVESGNLQIPGGSVGTIIQSLANGSQGIINKLNEDANDSNVDSKEGSKNKKESKSSKTKSKK